MTALLDVFGGILLALILFGVCNLQSWLERWGQERHFEDWPTGVPIRDGDHLAGQPHQRAVGVLGQTHLLTVRLHRTAEHPAEDLTAKVILSAPA